MSGAIRIANCSGFYGDRLDAAREMVEGGPIDVLTGDWLAELTMLILAKNRMKDPATGYARTFVKQMEQVMGTCLEKGIKVVANAGGLNPAGCAAAIKSIAAAQGLTPRIAWIEGDDLMPRLKELQARGEEFRNLDTGETLGARKMLTANAYLGGWGIVEALNQGADIVITGRTTDAAIVSGPAAWHHGWSRTDYDALAGAIVAGHVIECGCQATGGNYAFFEEIPCMLHPGFPIAEIEADGSSVITRHEGQGGAVTIGTVTAQLLYEIGPPAYLNPDVTAHFDTIRIEKESANRVRLSQVRGSAPPSTLKVSMNHVGGWRGGITMVLTGLDIDAKARLFEQALWSQFPRGRETFVETRVDLIRGRDADPSSNEDASAWLRIAVKDPDEKKVTKGLNAAAIELGLSNYPGLYAQPVPPQMYGVCWPTTIAAEELVQVVHLGDERSEVPCAVTNPAESTTPGASALPPDRDWGATTRAPLGRLFGARSGDKAGNANLGVWARDPDAYAWLVHHLDIEQLAALMPEAATHTVERYVLPNLLAVNFVFHGLLGEGVAASTRLDAQAKSLGEYMRALHVDIPKVLVG